METRETAIGKKSAELNCLCDLIFKRKFIYNLFPDSPKCYMFYLLIRKNFEIHISYIIAMIVLKQ